jgi:hypothetical protein
MYYLLFYGLLALWVLFDGVSRNLRSSVLLWTAGTILLGPVILPVWLASRPLNRGEVREGGRAWNILKNFAVLWTVVVIPQLRYLDFVSWAAGQALLE